MIRGVGVKKIGERVMSDGRTIITTQPDSFKTVDPGTFYVDPDKGLIKIKVNGTDEWIKPPERGIYVGKTPSQNPEVGDLWLDTNKEIEIDESMIDGSIITGGGGGKVSVNDEVIKNINEKIEIIKKELDDKKDPDAKVICQVSEIKQVVKLDKNVNEIKFVGIGNIKSFDEKKDILTVSKGTTLLYEGLHYKLNDAKDSIVNLDGNWNGATQPIYFEFRILHTQNLITNDTLPSVPSDKTESSKENNNISIIKEFHYVEKLNKKTDVIEFVGTNKIQSFEPDKGDRLTVIKNTRVLSQGIHYELTGNKKCVKSLLGEWNGTKESPELFDFKVEKNITTSSSEESSINVTNLVDKVNKQEKLIEQLTKTIDSLVKYKEI